MDALHHEGEKAAPTLKEPLKFVIEGKKYETRQQYHTGLAIKELAGIPADTDLYLSIQRPYEDELIANDTRVNLARPDIEDFFVKKKLTFYINEKEFVSYKQYVKGNTVRAMGSIPDSDTLYLDNREEWDDELILNDTFVDLARPGKERFYSKPKATKFALEVNGRDCDWGQDQISRDEVVALAYPGAVDFTNKAYTVTFTAGPFPNPSGELAKGDVVYIKDHMKFYVSATDRS